jgi:hypothetical protein
MPHANQEVAMKKIALAAFAALTLVPAAAMAQQYEEETGTLSVSDTAVSAGGSVTLSGSGFAPSSEVEITIESTPRTLDTVTANASGEIAVTVAIPSDLSAGTHTLKGTGVTPDGATLVLSATVSIAGGGQADLAGTGARIGPMAGAGAALLAIGIIVLMLSRRRSRA